VRSLSTRWVERQVQGHAVRDKATRKICEILRAVCHDFPTHPDYATLAQESISCDWICREMDKSVRSRQLTNDRLRIQTKLPSTD